MHSMIRLIAIFTCLIVAGSVSAEGDEVLLRHHNYTSQAPATHWKDNSQWMGTQASFIIDENGQIGRHLNMHIERTAQVYMQFGGVQAGKVYDVQMQARCVGQIELLTASLRQIPHPWKKHGQQAWQPTTDWATWRMQVRTEEDTPEHLSQVALFLQVRGIGNIQVRDLKIIERDAFELPENQTPPRGYLLQNHDFSVGKVGWNMKANARLMHNGQAAVTLNQNDKLVYDQLLNLYYLRSYHLSVTGQAPSGTLKLELYTSSIALSRSILLKQWDVDFTSGYWQGDYLPQLPDHGAMNPDEVYWLRLRSTRNGNMVTQLSLVEGDDTTIKPFAGIKINDGQLVDRFVMLGTPVNLMLRTSGLQAQTQGTLMIRDADGDTVNQLPVTLDTLPDGSMGSELILPVLGAGWYKMDVQVDGQPIITVPCELGILPRMTDRVLDRDGYKFLGGHHFASMSAAQTVNGVTGEQTLNPNNKIALGSKMGFASVRTHPPLLTKWWYVEPVQGQWRFPDTIVDAFEQQGMSVMGMLDGTARYASSAPENVLNNQNKIWLGWGTYPAKDLEDWKNYVRTIVGHYKDRITQWEVWNEPDHVFFNPDPNRTGSKAQQYAELVRTAYEAAKSVAPNVTIIAGAASNSEHFLPEAIDHGLLEYCDVISMHLYGADSGGSHGPQSYLAKINPLIQIMQQHNKVKPIWNSESCAFTSGIQEGETGLFKSDAQIKSILSAAAAGLQRFYLYSAAPRNYPGDYAHRLVYGYNGRPHIFSVITSVFDRLLNHRPFVANLGQDDQGVHLYAFKDSLNRVILAGWTENGSQIVHQDMLLQGITIDRLGHVSDGFTSGNVNLTDSVNYFVGNTDPALDLFVP